MAKEKSEIRSLVPDDLERALESKSIRDLPHIQKVGGLVRLLLVGHEKFGIYRLNTEKNRTEGLKRVIDELNSFGGKSLDDLPRVITEKLMERDDPFGFGPDLTRAILEMASDFFSMQYQVDSIRSAPYAEDWNPLPTDYLEITVYGMLAQGVSSGLYPLSYTKFPAGLRYNEIFPEDVKKELYNFFSR